MALVLLRGQGKNDGGWGVSPRLAQRGAGTPFEALKTLELEIEQISDSVIALAVDKSLISIRSVSRIRRNYLAIDEIVSYSSSDEVDKVGTLLRVVWSAITRILSPDCQF
jgi:hypothetical protein